MELEALDLTYTRLAPATVVALLEALPALHLAADLREPDHSLATRFGRRFFLGKDHDCGTPAWAVELRWRGDW